MTVTYQVAYIVRTNIILTYKVTITLLITMILMCKESIALLITMILTYQVGYVLHTYYTLTLMYVLTTVRLSAIVCTAVRLYTPKARVKFCASNSVQHSPR